MSPAPGSGGKGVLKTGSTAPPPGTFAAAGRDSDGKLTERIRNYMRVITDADPEAYPDLMSEAVREFGRHGPFADIVMPMLAQQWANADPMGAFEAAFNGRFASVIGEDDWGDAFGPILKTALEEYPEAVKELALKNQHLEATEKTLERLVVDEAREDIDKAIATIGEITNSELRNEVVESFLHRYAHSAPEKVLAFMEAFPGTPIPPKQVRNMFNSLTEKDPEAALETVEKLQSHSMRVNALGAIAKAWGLKDRDAALGYIERIESPTLRSEMLAQFHAGALETNPEAAAKGALAIPNRSERYLAISAGTTRWFDKDPEAARAWMDASLDAETWRNTAENVLNEQRRREKFAAAAPLAESLPANNDALKQFVASWQKNDAEGLETWIGTQSFERQNALRNIRNDPSTRETPAEEIFVDDGQEISTAFVTDSKTGQTYRVITATDPDSGEKVVIRQDVVEERSLENPP
ncbi:MAG: hypothetical protein AAGA58_03890 [Verrucomicrobiota bacterium]